MPAAPTTVPAAAAPTTSTAPAAGADDDDPRGGGVGAAEHRRPASAGARRRPAGGARRRTVGDAGGTRWPHPTTSGRCATSWPLTAPVTAGGQWRARRRVRPRVRPGAPAATRLRRLPHRHRREPARPRHVPVRRRRSGGHVGRADVRGRRRSPHGPVRQRRDRARSACSSSRPAPPIGTRRTRSIRRSPPLRSPRSCSPPSSRRWASSSAQPSATSAPPARSDVHVHPGRDRRRPLRHRGLTPPSPGGRAPLPRAGRLRRTFVVRRSVEHRWPDDVNDGPRRRSTRCSPRTGSSRRPSARRPTRSSPGPSCTTRRPRDDEGFWARQAAELIDWTQEWTTILDWQLPYAKWFVGGRLNVAANCLDRHVAAGHGDRVAIHFEGEPGDTRTITYADLLGEVERFANALKGLGVGKGDRVEHLPADDPRGGGGDARVRPHRRAAQGRVRRVLGAGRSPTASTTPRPSCSSPPTVVIAAARCSR